MARIGLLSDSHGRAPVTRRAVVVLLAEGAQRLIHLGDIGGQGVIDALVHPVPQAALDPARSDDDPAPTMPVNLVFGNNDFDRAQLGRYAQALGLEVSDPVGRLPVEGGELVYMHGDDFRAMATAVQDGVRYLCHGHTHRALDQRQGRTRVINPGALHRASAYTVAVLDTSTDRVTFHPVGAT